MGGGDLSSLLYTNKTFLGQVTLLAANGVDMNISPTGRNITPLQANNNNFSTIHLLISTSVNSHP